MNQPNMQPIFDQFYAKAEDLAKEAQPLDADAKQRQQAITAAEEEDAKDRAALAELERRVHALTTQIANRAAQLATARKELQAVEEARDSKTAQAEAIVGIVEREKARLAAEIGQELSGQPETPPTPVFDPLAGSPMVTRQDQMPPVAQDGGQPS